MSTQNNSDKQTLKVSVSGMTCDGCARTVANQFDGKEGVLDKTISYPDEQVKITFDPGKITRGMKLSTPSMLTMLASFGENNTIKNCSVQINYEHSCNSKNTLA